jgi:hypothetical protein
MLNRTLLVTLSLGLVAFGAALYGKLGTTSAQPAPDVAPLAHASAIPASAPAAATPPSLIENPEVARLAARRELYESVDALLQASELEKARKLLDEDQARYGDDLAPEWRDLEQSYRLIADCLEKPSARLRSRAQAFALVSQAQSLKPRVLEACSGRR